MVEEWGMSARLGFIRYAGEDTRESFIAEKSYSQDTARVIDEEVRRIVDEAYQDAARLLSENWEKVEALAGALLKYETLTADEVHRIMRGEPLDKPTVSELLAAESRRRAREEAAAKVKAREEPGAPPGGALPSPA
jgi:cell division protease FtsH